MSFTSPPDLDKLGLPQTVAQPLHLPDTSADIILPRKLGTVNCINVARLGEPIRLRYFGASAVCHATGQAHPTQAQAEADVLAWADGKRVAYEQHAVVPLNCATRCTKKAAPLADAALADDGELSFLAFCEHGATSGKWRIQFDIEDDKVTDKHIGIENEDGTLVIRDDWGFAMQEDFELICAMRNALPGLLARVRAAEAALVRYLPAPLPTGWVVRGELDPEEELRCEIELHHHGEGQPPLYATYWEGREGDFATWTDEQGNWYHDNEVARYRYAPLPSPGKEADRG